MSVTSDDIMRVQEIVALLGDAGVDVADVDLTAGEHVVDVTLTTRIEGAVEVPRPDGETASTSRRVHPVVADTESAVTPHEGDALDLTRDTDDEQATSELAAVCSECGETHDDGAFWDDTSEDIDTDVPAVAEVLATEPDEDGLTSKPCVERWLVEHLQPGETLTVTGRDVAEETDANVIWASRSLGQLRGATDVLDIERSREADPNNPTQFHITPVGEVGEVGTVDEDQDATEPRAVDEDTTTAVTPHESEDLSADAEETDAEDAPASSRWDIDCERCDELDSDEEPLRWRIHRTEAHGIQYSDYLEQGEFDQAVDEADSIRDLAVAIGRSYQLTIKLLNIYGYEDRIETAGGGGGSVTDFEFDDTDDQADVATDDADDQEAVTDGQGVDDDAPSVFERLSVDADDVIDAVTGAQSVHDVQRELWSLSREDLGELLREIGLLEDLDAGSARIDAPTARQAVQEVTR